MQSCNKQVEQDRDEEGGVAQDEKIRDALLGMDKPMERETIINDNDNQVPQQSTWYRIIMHHINQFRQWIGESSFRCWSLLYFCILIEITATNICKSSTVNNDTNSEDEDESSTSSDHSIHMVRLVLSTLMYNTSLLLFSITLSKIEMSVGYAIWSALGTASASICGTLFFGESQTYQKSLSILFIMAGIVGLNLAQEISSPKEPHKTCSLPLIKDFKEEAPFLISDMQ